MVAIAFERPGEPARVVDAPAGGTLMQAAKANRIAGMIAACGGDGGCATCHVHVDPAWIDRLPPPTSRECGTLRFARDRRPDSRLACQIVINAGLDGLRVSVPDRQY